MTALTAQDHWDIQQTLAYYGHLVDNAEWEGLAEVVTGGLALETPLGSFAGPEGVRAFEQQAAPDGLTSHHTLNTVVREGSVDGTAVAWSRFVLITARGTGLGGDYLDTLERSGDGWRIAERRVTERNRERPDGEYSTAGAENFAGWLARA